MADINNTGPDGADAQSTGAEGNEESPDQNSSTTVSQTSNEGGDNTDSGAGDDSGDGESPESDDSGGEPEPVDDGSEPSIRKDSRYWIGFRKGKKAAKATAKSQKDDESGEGKDDYDYDEEEDDSDDQESDDVKTFEKTAQKYVEPIAKKLQEKQNQEDLREFLGSNPHFKPYEKKMERYMKHPSRAHIPIDTIAMEAAGGVEGMLKIGAKLAREADGKKTQTKGASGSSRGGNDSGRSVWDIPDDQFKQMQDQIRRQ